VCVCVCVYLGAGQRFVVRLYLFIYVTTRRETFIIFLFGGRSVSAAGAACAGWQGLFALGRHGEGERERERLLGTTSSACVAIRSAPCDTRAGRVQCVMNLSFSLSLPLPRESQRISVSLVRALSGVSMINATTSALSPRHPSHIALPLPHGSRPSGHCQPHQPTFNPCCIWCL
jgi:hypothetical protein